jgi:alanine dehydrogenase
LVPEACGELVRAGHRVAVEQGAGMASGFPDRAYRDQGVEMLADAAAVYDFAELLVKVKEPVGPELDMLQARHLLFCFLHLAALPELQQRLLEIGLTAVAFETLADAGGLPILAPMSDIAGRLAVQIGSNLLQRPQGGKGLLLGGLPGVPRGRVVILGAGQAGGNAALVAADLGAEVTIFDKRRERLEAMRALGPNVTALYAYQDSMDRAIATADLLIGAVLIPGARAPRLVSAAQVAGMQPGSVVVDISVDQGGCIETTRPTTYADPTYQVGGVTHLCVTNMPGAVPRSASQALSAAILPYLLPLAAGELESNGVLRAGINVKAGALVHPALQ